MYVTSIPWRVFPAWNRNIECINNMPDIVCQHCHKILNATLNQNGNIIPATQAGHYGTHQLTLVHRRPFGTVQRAAMNLRGENMQCI